MTHYTYAHYRLDSNQVFYIGKGVRDRAWSANGRNSHWCNVVQKHGYRVQVLAKWPTHEEALSHEVLLIACFRDLGHPLVNKTDGGEGCAGYRHGPSTREKLRIARGRRVTRDETRAKIRVAMKGRSLTEKQRTAWVVARKQCARKFTGSDGRKMTSLEWAKDLGVDRATIYARARNGWPVDVAHSSRAGKKRT